MEPFRASLFDLLDETFYQHHGIYTDEGTSLFESLETIDAGRASAPISARGYSIAAHAAHVTLYLDVLEQYIFVDQSSNVDWEEIWSNDRPVTAEEWNSVRSKLKETAARVIERLKSIDNWSKEKTVDGAMAILAHTAYHLGAIRQIMYVV